MTNKEILTIIALSVLGLCLLLGLAKMAMKSDKAKKRCDYAFSLLVFTAVVLVAISQLLVEMDTYSGVALPTDQSTDQPVKPNDIYNCTDLDPKCCFTAPDGKKYISPLLDGENFRTGKSCAGTSEGDNTICGCVDCKPCPPALICDETDGKTANTAPCLCGTTACTIQTGLYCDKSTNTCNLRPLPPPPAANPETCKKVLGGVGLRVPGGSCKNNYDCKEAGHVCDENGKCVYAPDGVCNWPEPPGSGPYSGTCENDDDCNEWYPMEYDGKSYNGSKCLAPNEYGERWCSNKQGKAWSAGAGTDTYWSQPCNKDSECLKQRSCDASKLIKGSGLYADATHIGNCTSDLAVGESCTQTLLPGICTPSLCHGGRSPPGKEGVLTPGVCTLGCDASKVLPNATSVGDCTDNLLSGDSCHPKKIGGTCTESSCLGGVLTPGTCKCDRQNWRAGKCHNPNPEQLCSLKDGSLVSCHDDDKATNCTCVYKELSDVGNCQGLKICNPCTIPSNFGQNIIGKTCIVNSAMNSGDKCTVKCQSGFNGAGNDTYTCLSGILTQATLKCTQ